MTTNPTAIEIRDNLFLRVETMLDKANGRRRERTVTDNETVACLKAVINGKPFAYCCGGTVADAYNYRAISTFVMAARVDNRVYLGITTADAKSSTPGRAWSQLQPWRAASDYPTTKPEGPAGNAATKWAAWTKSPDVTEIDAMEVDAFLEAE